jgi:hypothetical protein
MAKSEIETKKWKVRTADQTKEISFLPTFEVTAMDKDEIKIGTNKNVECKFVDIEMSDADKPDGTLSMRMNFLDLYMFVYFIANEELRQSLQMRYERKVTEIPYEVTFKLDPEEQQRGLVKRLITLGVDEIAMAIARSEAQLLKGKITRGSVAEFVQKKNAQRKKGIILN